MTNVHPTLVLILAEVAVVASLALLVLLVRAWQRRRRERHAVATLVAQLQGQEGAWRQRLAEFLKTTCGLEEDQAVVTATELLKRRNRLYVQITGACLQHKPGLLEGLDVTLEGLLDAYRSPVVTALAAAGAAPVENRASETSVIAQLNVLVQQMTDLRTENDRLHSDLYAAQEDMKRTMTEYVSAYSGGHSSVAAVMQTPPLAEPGPEVDESTLAALDAFRSDVPASPLLATHAAPAQSPALMEPVLSSDLDEATLAALDAFRSDVPVSTPATPEPPVAEPADPAAELDVDALLEGVQANGAR